MQTLYDKNRKIIEESINDLYGEVYTNDPLESGYIFPNGKFLRMGKYGIRAEDHALCMQLYDDISYATSNTPKSSAQARFINEGNIRWLPESRSLDIGADCEPTIHQYNTICFLADAYGITALEFTDSNNNISQSHLYQPSADSKEIIKQIRMFYRKETVNGKRENQYRTDYRYC